MNFKANYGFVFHDRLQTRLPFVPVRGLLIGVGDGKNGGFIKMLSDDLQADGESFRVKTTRQRQGR